MENEELEGEVTVGTDPMLISTAKIRQEINYTNVSTGLQVIKIIIGKRPNAYAGAGGAPLLPWAVYWATSSYGYRPTTKDVWAVASADGATLAILER